MERTEFTLILRQAVGQNGSKLHSRMHRNCDFRAPHGFLGIDEKIEKEGFQMRPRWVINTEADQWEVVIK